VPLTDDAHFRAALATLAADDRKRDHPDFTLNDLSGKPWQMADLRGKVVLVNFWATWCPPCRKELPSLEALSARFAGQGRTSRREPGIRHPGDSEELRL
jgi:thiol-disulfide isomerase/thioredoxin